MQQKQFLAHLLCSGSLCHIKWTLIQGAGSRRRDPLVTPATEGRGTGELLSPESKRHMIQSQGFTLLTHAYVFYLIIGFSCTYCYQFVSRCYFSRQPQWETLVCRAIFAFLQVFMDIHIANTHINRMPFIFKQCFWSRMASQLREWKRSDLYHLSQWKLLSSHVLTSAESLQ